jgi:3-oxoacyl-ACP reductase-like protein
MRYLKRDSRSGEISFDKEKATSADLQARLDSIAREHGDTYIDGKQPIFDSLKARHFDPSWNCVRQAALPMYYDVIFGRLATIDRDITARAISLLEVTAKSDTVHSEVVRENEVGCAPEKGHGDFITSSLVSRTNNDISLFLPSLLYTTTTIYPPTCPTSPFPTSPTTALSTVFAEIKSTSSM